MTESINCNLIQLLIEILIHFEGGGCPVGPIIGQSHGILLENDPQGTPLDLDKNSFFKHIFFYHSIRHQVRVILRKLIKQIS